MSAKPGGRSRFPAPAKPPSIKLYRSIGGRRVDPSTWPPTAWRLPQMTLFRRATGAYSVSPPPFPAICPGVVSGSDATLPTIVFCSITLDSRKLSRPTAQMPEPPKPVPP